MKKLMGIILLIAGSGLLYWGYSLSQSAGAKFTKFFSGAHSDKVMILFISGAICLCIGLFNLYKGMK